MKLNHRRCGCGAMFELATLMSQERRCVACLGVERERVMAARAGEAMPVGHRRVGDLAAVGERRAEYYSGGSGPGLAERVAKHNATMRKHEITHIDGVVWSETHGATGHSNAVVGDMKLRAWSPPAISAHYAEVLDDAGRSLWFVNANSPLAARQAATRWAKAAQRVTDALA